MKLNGSNSLRRAAAPARGRGSRRARRGTAEIELLLVLPVLFCFLWLIKGSYDLGSGRLQNIFQAEEKAYAYATVPTLTPAGSDTGYLDASTGFTGVLPQLPEQLPNRMHVSQANQTVIYSVNLPLPPNNLTDCAAFPGPAWAYCAWPMGDSNGFQDASTTANWFADYAAQVRTDTITNALELSASSPP